MASLNINTEVEDQFYRYKMPRILAKVEGKGNGIKTVIVNMPEVAKALARPPQYPTKYFGCELGAQTQFDLKNERFIVNGSHDASKLQSLLDGFIKKFVLCPECSNPETNLTVLQKRGIITRRCIACGNSGTVDMRHKLTTYILKNPPEQEASATPTKGGKKKKSKKASVNGEKDECDGNSPEASAQEQMAAQRATGGDIDAPPEKDDDEDDWGEDIDVSEDAVKQRMEELSNAAKGLAMTDDLEKTLEERIDIFYRFIKDKVATHSVLATDKDILAEAERLEIKEKSTLILVEVLMNENVVKQLKQYRVLLLRFCHNDQKAQKYLLGGIEQLVGNVHKEALLSKVPIILKTLYDGDIVEEEVLIDWGKKVSKKYVTKAVSQEIHEKSKPFIKWLQEAEEEEESDDEDDHVEVAFSTTEKVGQQTVPKAKVEKDSTEEDDDEDFDIDAI